MRPEQLLRERTEKINFEINFIKNQKEKRKKEKTKKQKTKNYHWL